MFKKAIESVGRNIAEKILKGMNLEDTILLCIMKAEKENKNSTVQSLKKLIRR